MKLEESQIQKIRNQFNRIEQLKKQVILHLKY